jgi:TPP-dependent pyruvate/acetoin dehydrogenase alpha subunit
MDVVAVEAAARRMAEAVRAGGGPRFLETKTYRFRAHSMFDPELYRSKEEVQDWKKRDPIPRFARWLQDAGLLHEVDLERIEKDVARVIEEATAFAEAAPWEPAEDLLRDVYTPRTDTVVRR